MILNSQRKKYLSQKDPLWLVAEFKKTNLRNKKKNHLTNVNNNLYQVLNSFWLLIQVFDYKNNFLMKKKK
jgi:hypothetical protein